MKELIFLMILFSNSVLKLARREGVGSWAEFIWRYSSEVDRVEFNYENFVLNLKAIKENFERVPWKNVIPEKYFYHFVLPLRVTQEPLENFYYVYKDTLYELVKDCKSIKEAVLRINEWCFTKMEYKPTDPWDQSAVATINRGFGRCEEMSILFIKALRTVCIPVRYVYSPWWPFTESNHAWVEVWTEDGWHFLGAAEPTDFDFAWFRTASRRTALVLCSVFGKYEGEKGEVLKKCEKHTILNLTKNYTYPFLLRVKIVDEKGKPVSNVGLSLCVWNYSAFVPVWNDTLEGGYGEFFIGRTDIFLLARKGEAGTYSLIKPERDTVEVVLTLRQFYMPDSAFWVRTIKVPLDTLKPGYFPNMDSLIRIRETNFRLLKFPYADKVKDSTLLSILNNARGNWIKLWQFYENLDSVSKVKFSKYLSYFGPKDLVMLDTIGLREEITILDSMIFAREVPSKLIDSFVAPPRIFREEFGYYRAVLYRTFSRIFNGTPMDAFPLFVFDWVKKNIKVVNKREFYKPFQNAVQTLKIRKGTEAEVYVLVASILRTFGIPAKLSSSYDAVEYWAYGWKNFTFKQNVREVSSFPVKLVFVSNGVNVTSNVNYYYNYSLVKFDQIPVRLDFEPIISDSFQILHLERGEYFLFHGFRNVFGDVFAKIKKIYIDGCEDTLNVVFDTSIPIEELRESDLVVRTPNLQLLKEFGINEDDFNNKVFIAFIDFTSEISVSSLNSALEALKSFKGKIVIFAKNPEFVRNYLNKEGITSALIFSLSDDLEKRLGNIQIPGFCLIKNGKTTFYVEGLVLNLGSLLRFFD
ncbi:MAG: transglutaminase domain-containing protein [candidate division WOR-3 bacterium]